LPVEVAGQDVDDVDEPACQRAEFDCGRADSAVDGRRRGCGDLAGQCADLVGGIRGRVSRSGSLSSSAKLAPFGQMNPALKTSSRSPRAPVTRPSSIVSVRPQVASHKGQIRRAAVWVSTITAFCAD
jgi:hypothetical protein